MSDREFGGERVCFSMRRVKSRLLFLILLVLGLPTSFEHDFGSCLGNFLEDARRQHNIDIIEIYISSRSVVAGLWGHHVSSHRMPQPIAALLARMMQIKLHHKAREACMVRNVLIVCLASWHRSSAPALVGSYGKHFLWILGVSYDHQDDLTASAHHGSQQHAIVASFICILLNPSRS